MDIKVMNTIKIAIPTWAFLHIVNGNKNTLYVSPKQKKQVNKFIKFYKIVSIVNWNDKQFYLYENIVDNLGDMCIECEFITKPNKS